MRFKTDENLPIELTDLLRQHQHDALSVQDQQMVGQADSLVAQVCQAEDRALMTCDLHFADIRAYPPEGYHGIIILRPSIQSVSSLLRLMNLALPLIGVEPLEGCIWIVYDHRVCIRGSGRPGSP
jgi:predicted nuclease of predicted toxin-antitoxin system